MTTLLHRARLRTLSTLVAAALASQMAWAINPFTVRDIRVEGLQRVEPGTVFGSLPLRVGDTCGMGPGAGEGMGTRGRRRHRQAPRGAGGVDSHAARRAA